MERITLIVAKTFSRYELESTFKHLWIGEQEVPINGRSISQCLAEMVQQGWSLTATRARADLHGLVCEYDFERQSSVAEQAPVEQCPNHDALNQQK